MGEFNSKQEDTLRKAMTDFSILKVDMENIGRTVKCVTELKCDKSELTTLKLDIGKIEELVKKVQNKMCQSSPEKDMKKIMKVQEDLLQSQNVMKESLDKDINVINMKLNCVCSQQLADDMKSMLSEDIEKLKKDVTQWIDMKADKNELKAVMDSINKKADNS